MRFAIELLHAVIMSVQRSAIPWMMNQDNVQRDLRLSRRVHAAQRRLRLCSWARQGLLARIGSLFAGGFSRLTVDVDPLKSKGFALKWVSMVTNFRHAIVLAEAFARAANINAQIAAVRLKTLAKAARREIRLHLRPTPAR
ncbi:hypothetical protein BGZ51_001675 [Haplosporangium sp. Z 767]|nr:hypothetical protein BGZ51_001675 [Haplosporangium sp. Z 767]